MLRRLSSRRLWRPLCTARHQPYTPRSPPPSELNDDDDDEYEYFDDDDDDDDSSTAHDCERDRSAALLTLPGGLEAALDRIILPELRRHKSTSDAVNPTAHDQAALHLDAAYAGAHRALHEARLRLPGFTPRTMLDFGAQLSPAAWAASVLWPETPPVVTAVEPNGAMRALGQGLCALAPNGDGGGGGAAAAAGDEADEGAPPSVTYLDKMPAADERFDLVVAAQGLQLLPVEAQRAAVGALWGRVGAGGVLCVVAPASRAGFAATLAARDELARRAAAGDALRLVAPFAAAASEGWLAPGEHALQRWHTSQRVARRGPFFFHTVQRVRESRARAYLHRAERRKGTRLELRERLSYLLAQRPPKAGAGAGADADAVADAVARGACAPAAPAWARIVREPRPRKRHVLLDVATADGRVLEVTYAKRGTPRRCYRHARKAKMGDAWHWPLPEAA